MLAGIAGAWLPAREAATVAPAQALKAGDEGALPGGRGWRVRFLEPWSDWPTGDPLADAHRMNAWIEGEIRRNPAQYLWVHKRFKTRPPGERSVYRAQVPDDIDESDDAG